MKNNVYAALLFAMLSGMHPEDCTADKPQKTSSACEAQAEQNKESHKTQT